jgi:O-antigen ligase
VEAGRKPLWRQAAPYAALLPLLFFSTRGYLFFDKGLTEAKSTDPYQAGLELAISPVRYIAIALIYASILLLLVSFHRRLIEASIRQWLLFGLPTLAFASLLWTQNGGMTLFGAAFALANTLFGLYLAERLTPAELIDILARLGIFIALACAALAIFVPSVGLEHFTPDTHAWQGVFASGNQMGIVLTYYLATLLFLRSGPKRKGIVDFLSIALCLLLIVMSMSRAAWLLAIACILVTLYFRISVRVRPGERALVVILGMSTIVIAGILLIVFASSLVVLAGADAALVRRADLWDSVLSSIAKRPLFGYGFSAFWLGLNGESATVLIRMGSTKVSYAGNGPLELLLELGIAGLALYLFLLWRAISNLLLCLERSDTPITRWIAMVLFITLMGLFDGDSLLSPPHAIEWTLFVVAAVLLDREAAIIRGHNLRRLKRDPALSQVRAQTGAQTG